MMRLNFNKTLGTYLMGLLLIGTTGLLTARPAKSQGPTVPGTAQIHAILPTIALGFAEPVDGATVQAEINAAIAAGQPTYTLPATRINLTTTLLIPPGTNGFTLQGQPGTQLVRNSNDSFPMIAVGNGYTFAYTNDSFASHPQSTIAPAAAGSKVLTITDGMQVAPGWYAIFGVNPDNDLVRHQDGATTYWFKRELIRVIAVSGNQVMIDRPLGRDFTDAKLAMLDNPTLLSYYHQIVQNVTVKNLVLDGTSATNGSRDAKVLRANAVDGLTLENLTLTGFSTSAINISFSNGVVVKNCSIGEQNNYVPAYGIEFSATRFTTVRNTSFRNHRWGVIFQMGCQDGLVEDCIYTNTPNGGFDCGHGCGELRITYRRCAAPVYSIANPSYRRGANHVTLENCTAYDRINIYGNAENINIIGKHPLYANTATLIQFFTESGGQAIPAGSFGPISVTMRDGSSSRSDADGVNIQFLSISGTPRLVQNLNVENWNFVNSVSRTGAAVKLDEAAGTSNVSFTNCTFRNTYLYEPPIRLGPTSPMGRWNLTLDSCSLTTPYWFGVYLDAAARGTIVNNGSSMNGQALSDDEFYNLSTFHANSGNTQ